MAKRNTHTAPSDSTVNADEVAQFDTLGTDWWDEDGPMRPLHQLNPVRIRYIRDAVAPRALPDLRVLDIGCGGGLVTEPLARLGAVVTGLDAGKNNIAVAKAHAEEIGLEVDYLCTTAEEHAASGARYDVVTALEIIEHVDNPNIFISACTRLVNKDGLLILSTLNRTAKSFALGILAAEYLLRWVPAGTHSWKKFMKPSEIAALLAQNGFEIIDVCGLVYHPMQQAFRIDKSDISVNYLLTARKIKA